MLNTKICSICGQTKESNYFRKNRLECKECTKEEKKKKLEGTKFYICSYLKNHPCSQCGQTDIRTLDFHHIRTKKYAISELIKKGYSLITIQKEINKCIVLCKNCHAIKHSEENNNYKNSMK